MNVITRYSSILAICCAGLTLGCDVVKARADEADKTAQPPKKVSAEDQPSATVKRVDTTQLKAETFASALEISGKALAIKESYLSLSVPGRIQKIFVERGDRVKKGQVLVKLDRSGFQLGVEQAQAALDGAQAATEQLATEITRVDQLLAEGAAPTAAKDDLLAKDKGAQAQTRMAVAALGQAQKALKDSALKAPYDGVITDILKEAGEHAPAMPPTMLVKIVDASSLEVQVFAPEEASRFIKVGTEAEVIVDSADVSTRGKAVFVSNSIQPGARTFEVRILIENPGDKIKAGAFARVRLEEETLSDAILVPVSSLIRDDEDVPYVFVVEGGQAKQMPVTLGSPEGARVLIKSGLRPGQRLITSDVASLTDGQAVSTN